MERFRADGHLTEEALEALLQGALPGELERLEAAEHLAFCDLCLQRYMARLEAAPLLAPERSCQRALQVRLRGRSVRRFVSRYATAAAAVALALTLLWGGKPLEFPRPGWPAAEAPVSQRMRWPERLGDSLDQAVAGLSDFFDQFRF